MNTPQTSTSGYLVGMAISGAAGLWASGLGGGLALNQVILVGVRDVDPAEPVLIDAADIQVIQTKAGCTEALLKAIGDRPVYIHLDCDVLDAGVVPSDYQVEGGLSLAGLQEVSEAVAQKEIVGVEIAEFQYAWKAGEAAASPKRFLAAIASLLNLFRPVTDVGKS